MTLLVMHAVLEVPAADKVHFWSLGDAPSPLHMAPVLASRQENLSADTAANLWV
jgi:hypothetical protein